jgi:hypothetical protein
MQNSTLYASLMKATKKSYLIENCHWGICTDDDHSSCPTPSRDWCPMNFFVSTALTFAQHSPLHSTHFCLALGIADFW